MKPNTDTASRLAGYFQKMTANDGSTRVIFNAPDDSPDHQTLLNMTYAAAQVVNHDDAYEMVWDCLLQIADTEPDEIGETDRDSLIEVYTQPLMHWLSRNSGLADDMKAEFGQWPETLDKIAMFTQDYAYGLVLGAIESHWPEDADDDETDA